MLYDVYVPVKPVQISIDADLLRKVDADPETRKSGRSFFVRSAIECYLKLKDRERIEASIRKAYSGQADSMATDVSDLIEAQAWPED